MEVHHHPHVEKKGFKEYFLEFLMIFLAVTLGFFAENVREYISNRHKEKEYIISMVQDLNTHTAKFAYIIPANELQCKGYDSLVHYLFNFPYSDSSIRYIYYLQRKYGSGYINMGFTRRTFNQLQNAGGMQLIRDKTASDGIISYYENAANADQQIKEFSEDFMIPSLRTGFTILNSNYYKGKDSKDSLNEILESSEKLSFIASEPALFKTYANEMEACEEVLEAYRDMLRHQRNDCINLIGLLQKEYHLKDE